MTHRVGLLGFSIECNAFAPVATERDFATRTLLRGAEMVADARSAAPRMLAELPGFIADMDAAGPWEPVPILLAMAEPNGPVEQAFFDKLMVEWEARLRAAWPLDGVYCVMHGAGLTTGDDDPEGTVQAMVRRVVGPEVPVVASYDLHANLSEADIATLDALVGYRTNPHLDMRERGAESARILRRLMAGARMSIARVRLPIVPPTVTMLTAPEARSRPYGELIDLGQALMGEAPWAGRVVNVSVIGGFVYGDTPHNGLSVVVTATDPETAHGLALEIARAGWRRREQFNPVLTSLEAAVRLAKGTEDPSRPALIFADVADNPGGGGRGNTMFILSAFHAGGVRDAVIGLIHDPLLAAEAHRRGEGARFTAHFNRDPSSDFTLPFRAPALVARLHPGPVRGRRGIYAANSMDMGNSAALVLDGITVLVVSERFQCADPAFLEAFGIDIARQRVVVVKSRGHFRGGFDEFFRHDQVVEVDAPGLTSPMLHHFHWKRLPRPVVPLDANVTWSAEREPARSA